MREHTLVIDDEEARWLEDAVERVLRWNRKKGRPYFYTSIGAVARDTVGESIERKLRALAR